MRVVFVGILARSDVTLLALRLSTNVANITSCLLAVLVIRGVCGWSISMITFTIQVGMISGTSKKHEHEQEQIINQK